MSETTQEQPAVATDPVPEPAPQAEQPTVDMPVAEVDPATPQVSDEATVEGIASTARVSEIKVNVDGAVLGEFAKALGVFSSEIRQTIEDGFASVREHVSAEFSKLHRRL